MTHFDEQAFEALRRDADEVNRVRERAAEVLRDHRARAFDGFGDVLRLVLPEDIEVLTRVARILRLSAEQLNGLRWGDIDPVGLPREPLATLGQLVGLDLESFLFLVARDHARFGQPELQPGARSVARPDDSDRDGSSGLRLAWGRGSMDLPDTP